MVTDRLLDMFYNPTAFSLLSELEAAKKAGDNEESTTTNAAEDDAMDYDDPEETKKQLYVAKTVMKC